MSRINPLALALACGVLAGSTIGCGSSGSSEAANEELFHHGSLGEVAALYESYFADLKKPPTKLSDVAKYEMGSPTGYRELKQGEIIALWGGPLSESNSDKVFAYEKEVPASGGYVLMGDGKTIKKMTAEDFQQASKLAEVPKMPKP